MKKFAVAFVAAIAMQTALAADPAIDPANLAAVRELLVAMKYRETTALSIKQVVDQLPAQMNETAASLVKGNPNLSSDDQVMVMKKLDKSLPMFVAEARKALIDPGLVDEIEKETVPLYARNYTVDELRQLTAFYRSPLGQKLLAVSPKVMAESAAISNRVLMPRMQPVLVKVAQTLGTTE